MNDERILPYNRSQKLTMDELKNISAAGTNATCTNIITYKTDMDATTDID